MERELVEVSYLAPLTGSGLCEFLLHRTSDKTQPEVILIPLLYFLAPVSIFNKMALCNTSQHYTYVALYSLGKIAEPGMSLLFLPVPCLLYYHG